MFLHNMSYTPKSRNHKSKTKGRGFSSGMGKRSTRGDKGQKARKSGNVRIGFEGGQTPIYRRLPKVGFNNRIFSKKYIVISMNNVKMLNEKVIDHDVLVKRGLINKRNTLPIKIIGSCDLTTPISVTVDAITAGSKACILKANGNVALTTVTTNGK